MSTKINRQISRGRFTMIRFILFFIVSILISLQSVAAADVSREYKIKAAFIYNFSKFVTWPTLDSSSDFNVCVLDNDQILSAADSIKGKQVHGKQISVKKIDAVSKDCQIIFLGGSDMKSALTSIKGSPVLTLGDTTNFADEGGVIRLFVEDNKVRFEINLKSAESNGLQISDRLLGLANKVIR